MECGFFVMMILSCVELSDESKTWQESESMGERECVCVWRYDSAPVRSTSLLLQLLSFEQLCFASTCLLVFLKGHLSESPFVCMYVYLFFDHPFLFSFFFFFFGNEVVWWAARCEYLYTCYGVEWVAFWLRLYLSYSHFWRPGGEGGKRASISYVSYPYSMYVLYAFSIITEKPGYHHQILHFLTRRESSFGWLKSLFRLLLLALCFLPTYIHAYLFSPKRCMYAR